MSKDFKLYTDGALSTSTKTGGLAFLFIKDDKLVYKYSQKVQHTTNNRMELGAIVLGLSCITKPINSLVIISDSMYCIGCATLGWKRKKNTRLWAEFDKQMDRVSKLCSNITFKHVRGHQSDNSEDTKWNNLCDQLAVQASQLL